MIVKFRGNFDFIGLYDLLFAWLRDRHYRPVERKHKEKAGGEGKEVEIIIDGELEVNEYINYMVSFSIHVWDLKTVEIKEGDVTKKTDWGRLEVKMEGKIVMDPKNKIPNKTGILGAMDTFLKKVALWREIEFLHDDHLMITVGKVQAMVKKFLNMDTSETAFA